MTIQQIAKRLLAQPTSSAGLQQEGIAVVPEVHASTSKLVNGRHLPPQAAQTIHQGEVTADQGPPFSIMQEEYSPSSGAVSCIAYKTSMS